MRSVSLPPPEREHKTRGRSNPGGMDVLQVLGTDVQPQQKTFLDKLKDLFG